MFKSMVQWILDAFRDREEAQELAASHASTARLALATCSRQELAQAYRWNGSTCFDQRSANSQFHG